MSKIMPVVLGIVLIILHFINAAPAKENECDENRGICKPIRQCDDIFRNYHLIASSVKFCDEFNDIVCCPKTAETWAAPVKVPITPKSRHEVECLRFSELRRNCSVPFIVNGIKAEPKEFPFMALIGIKSTNGTIDWKCGGTLISENFVLTAAHCLVTNERNPKFHIRLGELDYAIATDDAQPQDFEVNNYVLNPYYNEDDDQSYDIGLMELAGRATFNKYVFPACLPTTDGNEHRLLTATGWGQLKTAGKASSHLLKVTLDRFDDDNCQEKLPDFQIDVRTQLCAGSYTSNSDTCQGDSGGPVFVQHTNYKCLKQVIGITSYGNECGVQNVPSVYTRVYLYTDWIERIVWGQV